MKSGSVKSIMIFFVMFMMLENALGWSPTDSSGAWDPWRNPERFGSGERTARIFFKGGESFVQSGGKTFRGNVLFDIPSGFLTVEVFEENVPGILRMFNTEGNRVFEKSFPKFIDLAFSSNRCFVIFYDGRGLVVLHTGTGKTETYEGSIPFSVDDEGVPAFFEPGSGCIVHRDLRWPVAPNPAHVLFFGPRLLAGTVFGLYELEKGKHQPRLILQGKMVRIQTSGNDLFVLEKRKLGKSSELLVRRSTDAVVFEMVDRREIARSPVLKKATNESIFAPLNYGTPDFQFPIGTSYGEIQDFGTSLYLHPGVDFLGEDYQEVSAVRDGVVRAIITIGGNAYWRIAVKDLDTSREEGYLYAHLNLSSIFHNVGDTVRAGQTLGTLYPWPVPGWTHVHFARIRNEGSYWYGSWWTFGNPLAWVTNMEDLLPPVFENAFENDFFAFRSEGGAYLSPDSLHGKIEIIDKSYDTANSDIHVDVFDLRYSFHPVSHPDSTAFERFAFRFDMENDNYRNGQENLYKLFTIYSRNDRVCHSTGGYASGQYYHILTRSDGDSAITDSDRDKRFDTTQLPNGEYILRVTAVDASGNQATASMNVTISNPDTDVLEPEKSLPNSIFLYQNFPNPANPATTIRFDIPGGQADGYLVLRIFDVSGRAVRTLAAGSFRPGSHTVRWDGRDGDGQSVASGLYFYGLYGRSCYGIRRMLLLK